MFRFIARIRDIYTDTRINRIVLTQVYHKLNEIEGKLETMAINIDALTAEVKQVQNVQAAAAVLINGIADRVAAAVAAAQVDPGTQDKIDRLVGDLRRATDPLAAAVTANTKVENEEKPNPEDRDDHLLTPDNKVETTNEGNTVEGSGFASQRGDVKADEQRAAGLNGGKMTEAEKARQESLKSGNFEPARDGSTPLEDNGDRVDGTLKENINTEVTERDNRTNEPKASGLDPDQSTNELGDINTYVANNSAEPELQSRASKSITT